jgi:hypothetical protein
MRPTSLEPRDRRAILIGLAVLLPMLVYVGAAKPFVAHVAQLHEQLESERGLLQRELTLLEEVQWYPALLGQADSALQTMVPRLFGGVDGVTATAALAGYAAREARRSRMLVQLSESQDPVLLEHGVIRLEVTIRAISDLEGVLTYFHALDQGPRLVQLQRFAIERAPRSGLLGADAESPLALTATLYGYAVAPAVDDEDGAPSAPAVFTGR